MEYRKLGNSGLMLSCLSYGSWVTFKNQVDLKKGVNLMAQAYEGGVNFFDNAEAYADGESEVIMGEALKKLKWGRDRYCVSSKVFWGGKAPTQRGLSKKHVFEALHAALKRLQLDYLDLYFCHRPDLHTPISETVWAMHQLVMQGKVLYWGTSEWSSAQIMEAHLVAREHNLVAPTMEQPQYNLLTREKLEKEYLTLFEKYGMGTTIWSPLASGLLTGKYNEGIPEGSRMTVQGLEWLRETLNGPEGREKLEKVKRLGALATDLGITTAQLSLAWCLKNKHVSTVILGAGHQHQLQENLDSLNHLDKLNSEVMEKIDRIVDNGVSAEPDFRG